jgi:hypothetical protein
MKFRSLLYSVIILIVGCGPDEAVPVEPVIYAYDTLENRYEQRVELVVELLANVSMDSTLQVQEVSNLLGRDPIVSIDFRKPVTTNQDILHFVAYQNKLDAAMKKVFAQIDSASKWRGAPLIQEFKANYFILSDSIRSARDMFNEVSKSAGIKFFIPADTARRK